MKKIFLFFLTIFLIGTISALSWTENLNNGLIGYWGMNEGSGNNLAEEVYGINNATAYGGIGWKSGINENATGDYILEGEIVKLSNSNAYSFKITDPFSISFWKNQSSIPRDGYYITKEEDGSGRGWSIRSDKSSSLAIYIIDTWPNAAMLIDCSGETIGDGRWKNYVVTYDGSKGQEGFKAYLNGSQLNCSLIYGINGSVNNITSNNSLEFGAHLYLGAYNYQMNGQLDETAFWNRVLTPSEISQLYNNGNGIIYTPLSNPNVTSSLGAIQWENESRLNVNSSNWWNFMDGFDTIHFVNSFNKLTLSESWINSFVRALINYNYILNLGFYPSSNPSNFYNSSTLPPQKGISFTYYNITDSDKIQKSNSENLNILSLPLTSGKKISIECNLFTETNKGAKIQLISALSGTSSRRQVIEYPKSAAEHSTCSGTDEILQCSDFNNQGITKISLYTSQSSSGNFILDLKSKNSGKSVYVRAGSWCRSVEL